MCMSMCIVGAVLCICESMKSRSPWSPKEGIRLSGTAGGCEHLSVGAREHTQVICNSVNM